MQVLDAAGIPYTVVAGNHDLNTNTGAHPLYDQYFGPSRYANAEWTPSIRKLRRLPGAESFRR